LLGFVRSAIYYKPKPTANDDAIIMNEMREIYLEHPYYGYRKMQVELRKLGFVVNRKKVYRLMRLAGLKAIYPEKKTTVRNSDHAVYPYLLKGLAIDRPDQVWQVDITYIKMRRGFVYLICLIDVYSRKIMGWSLSTSLDTQSCLEALSDALKLYQPDIVNSDQGCQFTSKAWVEALAHGKIKISMDGKGRWADNVYVERLWRTIKYEHVFLRSFDDVQQARDSLGAFIKHYNNQRSHQSLNYHTPSAIHGLKRIPTKQELFDSFKIKPQEANMIPKIS
jgi:putative transposase